MAGENGKKSTRDHIYDRDPSKIDPIPYYPNLHRQLHSLSASILVAYLEIHHPPPQDANGQPTDGPVRLELDRASDDLQVSRRTLYVTLAILSVFWKTEEARARGARARREFIQPDHIRLPQAKLYSVTGSKSFWPGSIWGLRRNFPLLAYTLQQAGFTQERCVYSPPVTQLDGGGALVHGASSGPLKSLSELIIERSALGGDGRVTRPARERGSR